MAKAMENAKKQTKRDRQRAAAEARQAARRRQAQRRTLAYALGGLALIAVVVLAVFAFMGDGGGQDAVGPSAPGTVSADPVGRTEPLGPGEAIPEFSAPGIDGGTVSWSDHVGAPAVITIWAPWCAHCQAELPVLDEVMQDNPDVTFLTVVTSIGDSPGPDPKDFLQEHGIEAPTAVDDAAGTLASAFGIRGFPTLYFVGSDGAVVQEAEGEVDEETLREIVGSLS
jgi:peptide methionine sulfoxide reductase msrA/msrB